MRIMITGGAGFLGSHICEFLLGKGHQVVCMDNLVTGSLDNIRHLFGKERFLFVKQDVTQFIHLPGRIDAVMHFASPASPVDYLKYPIPTLKVGSLGTHKTLGFAKEKKALFMLASTSEVYGDPLTSPQRESYWGNVNPIGPRGVYDEAKRFAEAMTFAYHRSHGIPVRIVRIFNTYGPRMRLNDGRAVPNFVTQALAKRPITVYGDGSQTRSLCYVDDLVAGIYSLLLSDIDRPVNIGNPEELTLLELAKLVKELTRSPSRIVYKPLPVDDPKVRCPDITLAKKALRWRPRITLRTGLAKTIPYFRAALKKPGRP
ncbi:MAG: NAD-dependent dehydratase [Elusimicrobia bacterium RIFCSPLOWO2_01_FULL_64_13]|nr:MAG: NAD-dependent dehydratase [Elusimicrobia bacterium RIFCSPLOWO2_01_FULL_64_13]